MNVLITGGAGFIGSHLADELLERGYRVRALDSLLPQVHGPACRRPDYLNKEVELICGDVRDAAAVRKALKGIDAVFHFAAMVGVGQSMYEIAEYTSVNNFGTAVLLQELVRKPVARLVVASSMSLYGEGLYRDCEGKIRNGVPRSPDQLRAGDWELRDEKGRVLCPIPTPEDKTPQFSSIYAQSKFDQEQMSLVTGRAYGFPVTALRFFNVYGPRQALSNPYTGVLAIFAARLLNGNPPLIFEDGRQVRDLVSVHDITQACRLVLEKPNAAGRVFNVGSGTGFRICDIAERMAKVMELEIEPQVTGQYRAGDIRHCFADITLARHALGYGPRVTFERGMEELASWLDGKRAEDRFAIACSELSARGLAV